MQKFTLQAKKRQFFRKKAKNLLASGLIPATVYGKKVEPVSIEVKASDFEKIYKKSGETQILEMEILEEKEKRPVLVHQMQMDPVTSAIQHIEFLQVDLTQKVTAKIPIAFFGEASAIKEKKGNFLELLDEIEVEALPQDLPPQIEVNVEGLSEVGQFIKVSDLILPKGVTVKTDPEELVCKIEEEKVEEEPVVTPAEAVVTEAPEASENTKETGES